MQQFEASAEIFKGVRVVTVRGELDIATSPQMRELLSDVFGSLEQAVWAVLAVGK